MPINCWLIPLFMGNNTLESYPSGIDPFMTMQPSFLQYSNIGISSSDGILVYPNPVKGKLYLKMDASLCYSSVELYNLNGQKILIKNCQSNQFGVSIITTSLNLSGICPGIYFLKTICANEVITNKLMKYP